MNSEIYEKRISLLVSVIIALLSILWECTGEKFEIEPLISFLAAGFSVYLQRKNWTIERIVTVHTNPPSQVPQVVSTTLDFAIREYVLIVKPQFSRAKYWRIGFKMASNSLIPTVSQIDVGYVTFSVELDGDILSMSYHDETGRPSTLYKHRLITGYNENDFKITSRKGHGNTIFTIYRDGSKVDEYAVPGEYRYGKVLTWADNHDYQLTSELIVIP